MLKNDKGVWYKICKLYYPEGKFTEHEMPGFFIFVINSGKIMN